MGREAGTLACLRAAARGACLAAGRAAAFLAGLEAFLATAFFFAFLATTFFGRGAGRRDREGLRTAFLERARALRFAITTSFQPLLDPEATLTVYV